VAVPPLRQQHRETVGGGIGVPRDQAELGWLPMLARLWVEGNVLVTVPLREFPNESLHCGAAGH
jgi:hypothetical protein